VLLLLQEAVLAQWKAKQNVVEMPVLGMLAIVRISAVSLRKRCV
jgi:hypothetical protein